MNDIYWIGPRQSDIEDLDYLFKGSITIYGDNTNGNISFCDESRRINHNIDNESCNKFIKEQLLELIHKKPNSKLLFYNQEHAFRYGKEIELASIGINDRFLLENLSNKAKSRYIFSNIVDVIPCITLKGKDCFYDNLCNFFKTKEFVIQNIFSSGGYGTYHITQANSNAEKRIITDENGDYLISPYFDNALSLNIHIIVTEDNIILFPPSIQIVYEKNARILYSGADFVCFKQISEEIKNRVNEDSFKIAAFLKEKGFKGIAGIDFILHNGKLFFMELNSRFQASTELINKSLMEKYKISMQELHLLAFKNKEPLLDLNFDVEYSNIVYTTDNISSYRLRKVLSSSEIQHIQLDGYKIDKCLHIFEENSIYLCRCIFKRNVCTLRNGNLLIHPNIYTEDIKTYILSDKKYYKENVKFALLNHGLTLSNQAILCAQKIGIIKEAVFDAIDITIFDNIKVNVPFSCNFSTISPFTVDIKDDEFVLLFDNYEITKVRIDFIPETLIGMKTSSGVPFEAIINFSTDRIRINPAPICIYKKNNIACRFCNLPEQNYKYNINDIIEVIDYCLANIEFRHFLIGGGTYSLTGGWDVIIEIAKYIRNKCLKDIYLMSIPPQDLSILDKLKKAGVTEVSFNLEIFDRELAGKIMPGKGMITLNQYTAAFKHATKLWGKHGKVRSLLIYGFDTDEVFLKGLENLCMLGVEPIVSIFRPLPNTQLEYLNPPATQDIFTIYKRCKSTTELYSLSLGPDCPDCQNNTLSFT